MCAIICIFDFMNFMSFLIKFIKFKPIIKFKKFELHNNAWNRSYSGGSVNSCTINTFKKHVSV